MHAASECLLWSTESDSSPESVSQAVEFTENLEDSRYRQLWMTDSHQLYADIYAALALAAAATKDAALSNRVTNPVTRHPTVTANAIFSVNKTSEGRTMLAIGTGDSAVYSIGHTPARVDEFARTVQNLRFLFAGNVVEFDNESSQFLVGTHRY